MPADFWILIFVLLLCVLGIGACFFPGVPGVLLNYVALWMVQYKYNLFSETFIIIWSLIIALAIFSDYFMPVWFAKKYGYSKYRARFMIIGMGVAFLLFPFLGLFLAPLVIITAMLIGAIAGEIVGGREKTQNALASGIAGFAGAMLSVILKLVVSTVLSIYLFVELTKVS